MNLAPIVLFVYNRPWHTQQTVKALQKNELAQESELFIYADNAKNDDTLAQVKEVRDYIKTIKGFKKITIIKRDKNWGLANSIIDGVTKIVNQYSKIIVLEDDLVTSPYFLRFMNDGLEFYKDNEKVMHISGSIYPIDNQDLEDTYFIKPATCWGWGTWNRAWKYFKKDTNFYLKIFDKKMIKDFNLNNSYDYFSQIIANKKGKINTWAVFWYASVYLEDGLSLHSKESFTKNIGHDGMGENCSKTSVFDVDFTKNYPVKFTTQIEENLTARQRFEKFFKNIKLPLYRRLFIVILKTLRLFNSLRIIYGKIKAMKNLLKRLLKKPNWYNLKNIEPVSKVFGLDRGTPISRVYINDFLYKNKEVITGITCEIAENSYSKQFGKNITKYEILHYTDDNQNATIIGDLNDIKTLPKDKIDCFILTQTLDFIYDFKGAIKGVYYMLNERGIALVTVSGISQISRYDYERWGDYWKFTDMSIKKSFVEVFGSENVEVEIYGNVLSATAALQGISAEELTQKELFYKDNDYQVTICIKAIKIYS